MQNSWPNPDSEGQSINLAGQIVGESGAFFVDGGVHRGVLWESGEPIVDLNTLVLPSNGTDVITAQFINDRGEIACTGTTAAVPDEHPCMLIPCDENHPGIEGCDYSPVDASTAVEVHPLPTKDVPAEVASQVKLSPVELMARYRRLVANRHRTFGVFHQ